MNCLILNTKIILFSVLLGFGLVAPAYCAEPNRALFVSQIQDPQVLSSREEIDNLLDFAKKAKIKIIFMQIYRSSKSWFPSEVVDSQPYRQSFKAVGQDPFALFIEKAQSQGIEVHAWLNLLSLSVNRDSVFLKKYGPDILTQNLQRKRKLEDYKIDNQYFLEPGDPRVRADLSVIVEEILLTYPKLDGIQFDYIRYPDVSPYYGYTKINMSRFKQATGLRKIVDKSQVWQDWKRAQVTELLTLLVQKVHSLRPAMRVSTTGCMPYSRAYHEAFQDWPAWVNSGLVDFVTVMNYSDDPLEYAMWNETIRSKVIDSKKLKMTVGAYKFIKKPEIFEQELRICEKSNQTCAIFHYGNLLENSRLGDFLTSQKK